MDDVDRRIGIQRVGLLSDKLYQSSHIARPGPSLADMGEVIMLTSRPYNLSTLGICVLATAGCASLPPSQDIEFYYPKAQTHIEVIQTIGCASDGLAVVSEAQVIASTTYSADKDEKTAGKDQGEEDRGKDSRDKRGGAANRDDVTSDLGGGLHAITFEAFGSSWNDPDVDVTYTEDGRLKGISANTTGEGGAVLRGVATTAAALSLVLTETRVADATAPPETPVQKACGAIGELVVTAKPTDPKVLTLIYASDFQFDGMATSLRLVNPEEPTETINPAQGTCPSSDQAQLTLDVNSQGLINASKGTLEPYIGPFCLRIDNTVSSAKTQRSRYLGGSTSSSSHYLTMALRPVKDVVLQVWGPESTFSNKDRKVIWSGIVSVPQAGGTPYYVLIPSGALFGSEKFSMALADDGSITEIHYGASGGASDTVGVLQGVAQAYPSKETRLQDENDLIYQQQRHIICTTDPQDCPNK